MIHSLTNAHDTHGFSILKTFSTPNSVKCSKHALSLPKTNLVVFTQKPLLNRAKVFTFKKILLFCLTSWPHNFHFTHGFLSPVAWSYLPHWRSNPQDAVVGSVRRLPRTNRFRFSPQHRQKGNWCTDGFQISWCCKCSMMFHVFVRYMVFNDVQWCSLISMILCLCGRIWKHSRLKKGQRNYFISCTTLVAERLDTCTNISKALPILKISDVLDSRGPFRTRMMSFLGQKESLYLGVDPLDGKFDPVQLERTGILNE